MAVPPFSPLYLVVLGGSWEGVRCVVRSFLGVGIMLVIVTRVCYGHVNPRSAFLDHSWALFHVRKKEVEKRKLRKIMIVFKIFFHGPKVIL